MMTKVSKASNDLAKGMLWPARVASLLVSGLFLLFVVESGARVVATLDWSSPRGMPLLLVLVLSVEGVNTAWRWAKLGGTMAVAGGLTMIALVTLASGPDGLLGVMFFAFPILFAGVLHLVHSLSVAVAARAEMPEPAPVRRRRLQPAT
jgi:hypothetical protein